MLTDIIEELKPTLKELGTPVQLSSNPDSSDGLIFYEDAVEKIVAETAQIVAREVLRELRQKPTYILGAPALYLQDVQDIFNRLIP
jgi:hypothetical protein